MVSLKIHLGQSLVSARFAEKYGKISHLIPQLAENDWFFYWRLTHLRAKYSQSDEICAHLRENFGVELVAQNAYHKIEKSKSCYFITLK